MRYFAQYYLVARSWRHLCGPEVALKSTLSGVIQLVKFGDFTPGYRCRTPEGLTIIFTKQYSVEWSNISLPTVDMWSYGCWAKQPLDSQPNYADDLSEHIAFHRIFFAIAKAWTRKSLVIPPKVWLRIPSS
jgi:hypothetical protein